MPTLTCRRCGIPLTPIYPDQTEHPLCSPTPTGWIPHTSASGSERHRAALPLALAHAARGWHVLPLSPSSKRPLGNCLICREDNGRPPHRIADCPCIPAGGWCHGVRAATTDTDRITSWWQHQPDAIPGIAAGPSGLTLIDIDNHDAPFPADPATGLLPGIDLAAEGVPKTLWSQRNAFRDGRDSLRLLTRLRGGKHPWPSDSAHRPFTATTPSGGRHLWYRTPADNLRQALDPHSIGWQIDIKAGWSYGIAPGATTRKGAYRITGGDPANPGHMPEWLAREIIRVATRNEYRPTTLARPRPAPARGNDRRPAAYLTTAISRGATKLATLTAGRKSALAALAYQTGGLLEWSGLLHDTVSEQLIDAGITAGLHHSTAVRIVYRSLTQGLKNPLPPPKTSAQ